MSEAKLLGGSESDRKKLLQLLDDYIVANGISTGRADADLERIARGHVLQSQRPHL